MPGIPAGAQGKGQTGPGRSRLGAVQNFIVRDYIGRADKGRVSMRSLGDEIGRSCRVPSRTLPTCRGRPHEIEDRREVDDEVDTCLLYTSRCV